MFIDLKRKLKEVSTNVCSGIPEVAVLWVLIRFFGVPRRTIRVPGDNFFGCPLNNRLAKNGQAGQH
jgi:hypothetical protein